MLLCERHGRAASPPVSRGGMGEIWESDDDDVTKSMEVSSIREVRIRNPSGRC